jgi:hypothetical protein
MLCVIRISCFVRFDSDFDISDNLSPKSLSLRVIELENALCNQDKLLYKVFHENRKLNLKLESAFFKFVSLRSVHDDMSAKPCDNYKMIMVNYLTMVGAFSCCKYA